MRRSRELYNFDDETKWEAKKRAHFHCEWPGCKEKHDLQVHHLMPCAIAYKYYPHLLPEIVSGIDNAQVLCKKHHKIEHNKSHDYGELAKKLNEIGNRVRV